MALEQKLARSGIGAALALMLGLGILSHRSAVEQAEAAEWVAHTHEVIEALQKIASGVAEGESALRAFAIMREPRFLEDFEPGIALARDGLDSAKQLTLDNTAQQRLVRRVEPLLDERIRLLRGRQQLLGNGAPAHVSDEAIRVSKQIRTLVNEGISNERALLLERNQFAHDRAAQSRVTTLVGLLASMLSMGGAFALFDREMRRRRLAQQARLTEVSLLLELGEVLQACRSTDEAFTMIGRIGPRFFEGVSGAVTVMQASRNAVEVKAAWGAAELAALTHFEPEQCWGLRRGRLHGYDAQTTAMSCEHWQTPAAHTRCLPLIANGELLGALHLASRAPLAPETEQRIGVFGEQVALATANLQLREVLRNQSIRDPLTKLFNRRYSEETLRRELARAEREKAPASLLMLDIDHFKRFNDSYGHETGDEVLKQVAQVLQLHTRTSDMASRLGGEELMVLLPNANLEQAMAKAENLRATVAALTVRAQGKAVDSVTVSIGVSAFPEHGASADELVRAADAALYRAKNAGRNRVLAAE